MTDILIWLIAALSILGVPARPFGTPEWPWAILGALVLIFTGLVSRGDAIHALGAGVDVYLFLLGMMMLSEMAREEGVFEWIANLTAASARKSASRLFFLIYAIGILVTAFMSNDATAVVLTPAIYQCVRKAGAKPKPYLFACALVANAASFILPISNPANLVVYGKNLPTLFKWLKFFALPSAASIAVTFLILKVWFREELDQPLGPAPEGRAALPFGGRVVLVGLALTTIVLLACSAMKVDLGAPTFASALVVLITISLFKRNIPRKVLKNISWSVVPLVGGLFVIVEAVNRARILDWTKDFLAHASNQSAFIGKQMAAFSVGVVSNLANNLPVGLTSGLAVQSAGVSEAVNRGVLIGVDLGPNLSVTGSLATILWLMAIRREGETISSWEFFFLGLIIMPLSLFASVAVS